MFNFKYIFWLAALTLLILSCKNQNDLERSNIQLEFDGFKEEFYKKYDLLIDVRSENAVKSLFDMHKESKVNSFCRLRPVKWKINVFQSTKADGKKLFTINANLDDEVYLIKDGTCYENPLLIQTMKRLVRFSKIRDYEGRIDQEVYNGILKEESKIFKHEFLEAQE